MSDEPNRPRVILVTGPSGAGKTVLSLALVEALGEAACVRIGLDDYYADKSAVPLEDRSATNFDHPDAIDWALLMDHVGTLLTGGSIDKPCYDFVAHARLSEAETVHPRSFVVMDGIHAMADDGLVELAALTVFVEAERETCLARRLVRDTVERGRSEASVRAQFDGTVWPMAERFVLPARARADVVVGGVNPIGDSIRLLLERID